MTRKILYIVALAWVLAFIWQTYAHARPLTPEGEPNPLDVPPRDTIATLPSKPGSSACKKLDMELVDGEMHVNADCWGEDIWLKSRGINKCYPAIADKLERQDDISFLEYVHCGESKRFFCLLLKGLAIWTYTTRTTTKRLKYER